MNTRIFSPNLSAVALAVLAFSSASQSVSAQATEPDVIGIKLGMTPDEAVPLAKKYANGNGKRLQVSSLQLVTNKHVAIPNGKHLSIVSGAMPHMDSYGNDTENSLAVAFTPIPQNERVAGVYRKLAFKGDQRPLSATIAADVKTKYGAPTATTGSSADPSFIWAYDENGRLMSAWKGASCMIAFPRPNPNNYNPTSMELLWSNVILREWRAGAQNYVSSCGAKHLITRLKLNDSGLVHRMDVLFYDISAVLKAQRMTSDFMDRAEGKEVSNAVEKAKGIRSPAL